MIASVSCILQIDPIQVLRGIRILWRDLDFAASSADQLDLVVVRPAWRVIRQACLLYCQGCIRLVIRILAFVVVIQGIRALRKRRRLYLYSWNLNPLVIHGSIHRLVFIGPVGTYITVRNASHGNLQPLSGIVCRDILQYIACL